MYLITITICGIDARETAGIIQHFAAQYCKTKCPPKAMKLFCWIAVHSYAYDC